MNNQTFDPKPFSWVRAEFPWGVAGNFLSAWYTGKDSSGNFLVEFSDDGPSRAVKQIFPFPTPEELDDETELKTGCRFDNLSHCKSPDCKHNGFQS